VPHIVDKKPGLGPLAQGQWMKPCRYVTSFSLKNKQNQTMRAPWPENMANSLHGFLDKKAKNEAKMAEKCQK